MNRENLIIYVDPSEFKIICKAVRKLYSSLLSVSQTSKVLVVLEELRALKKEYKIK